MDKIDEIDAHILRLVQTQGRIKRNKVAEAIGLSVPAASERPSDPPVGLDELRAFMTSA